MQHHNRDARDSADRKRNTAAIASDDDDDCDYFVPAAKRAARASSPPPPPPPPPLEPRAVVIQRAPARAALAPVTVPPLHATTAHAAAVPAPVTAAPLVTVPRLSAIIERRRRSKPTTTLLHEVERDLEKIVESRPGGRLQPVALHDEYESIESRLRQLQAHMGYKGPVEGHLLRSASDALYDVLLLLNKL